MGLTDSPYRSLQLMIKAKHAAYGDRQEITNPFGWVRVWLNLPGSKTYDPTLPWVMKIRVDGHLACEVYLYVDDGRITGWCSLECWRAARRFCAECTRLGIQDASRKRTAPTQQPGPWAGTVVHTHEGVVATVSSVKWERTRSLILELRDLHQERAIPHKRLEQIRVFLIYVARTYRWMTPYLKGIHLTLDSWREDRDGDGWKVPRPRCVSPDVADWEMNKRFEEDEDVYAKPEPASSPPDIIHPVSRMEFDIKALIDLTSGVEPAVQKCRVKSTLTAFYLLGDASGKGFGSGFVDGVGVWYEAANWSTQMQEESSNFREAENLVKRIEELGASGGLNDRELFTFTDNSTFESTYYKGHSSSRKLNKIIFRLRKVERMYGVLVHVIWIAGTRMKRSGIDGLSRGDLLEGMMAGLDPLSFIPLNEDASRRTKSRVVDWIASWWSDRRGQSWCGLPLKLLAPEDWFELHNIWEPRLWIPPPAAMETVVEIFNEDRLAHPQIPHVFAVPCLMTHVWRKALSKDADVLFSVKPGASFWPCNMHEPLLIMIVLPLTHVPNYFGPWIRRKSTVSGLLEGNLEAGFKNPGDYGSRKFYDLEGAVPCLWEGPERWSGALLFQFLNQQKSFPPVLRSMVRGMLPKAPKRSLPDSNLTGRRRKRRFGNGDRGQDEISTS